MSEPAAFVFADLREVPHPVGRLWASTARGRETATFEYDDRWLANPERFSLEPALTLGPGPYHTAPERALFGALGDSAPDRWGRTLIARAEGRRAAAVKQKPRALHEIDYLLRVSDFTRQGALRFALKAESPFVATSAPDQVPPLVELPHLLAATERVLTSDDTEKDLRLLLAPGSSLGGARPKASVRERNGALLIAKFPAKADVIRAVLWEAVALTLARRSGIQVSEWRLESVLDVRVLLLQRFDRHGTVRIPFLSAMSMLGATEHGTRSYVEIAEALRQHGATVQTDLAELWRRIVFSVLISNLDDHLRNHGFLYNGVGGWRLSPAYDLNPVPADLRPRVLSTPIGLDGDATASLELAMDAAAEFALKPAEARRIVREVRGAVSKWRPLARSLGLSRSELDRMASAFLNTNGGG
ncbi:MAG: type II toxin-antitoxin system HipA family toxin [Gemmatimonadaceae bacterium]